MGFFDNDVQELASGGGGSRSSTSTSSRPAPTSPSYSGYTGELSGGTTGTITSGASRAQELPSNPPPNSSPFESPTQQIFHNLTPISRQLNKLRKNLSQISGIYETKKANLTDTATETIKADHESVSAEERKAGRKVQDLRAAEARICREAENEFFHGLFLPKITQVERWLGISPGETNDWMGVLHEMERANAEEEMAAEAQVEEQINSVSAAREREELAEAQALARTLDNLRKAVRERQTLLQSAIQEWLGAWKTKVTGAIETCKAAVINASTSKNLRNKNRAGAYFWPHLISNFKRLASSEDSGADVERKLPAVLEERQLFERVLQRNTQVENAMGKLSTKQVEHERSTLAKRDPNDPRPEEDRDKLLEKLRRKRWVRSIGNNALERLLTNREQRWNSVYAGLLRTGELWDQYNRGRLHARMLPRGWTGGGLEPVMMFYNPYEQYDAEEEQRLRWPPREPLSDATYENELVPEETFNLSPYSDISGSLPSATEQRLAARAAVIHEFLPHIIREVRELIRPIIEKRTQCERAEDERRTAEKKRRKLAKTASVKRQETEFAQENAKLEVEFYENLLQDLREAKSRYQAARRELLKVKVQVAGRENSIMSTSRRRTSVERAPGEGSLAPGGLLSRTPQPLSEVVAGTTTAASNLPQGRQGPALQPVLQSQSGTAPREVPPATSSTEGTTGSQRGRTRSRSRSVRRRRSRGRSPSSPAVHRGDHSQQLVELQEKDRVVLHQSEDFPSASIDTTIAERLTRGLWRVFFQSLERDAGSSSTRGKRKTKDETVGKINTSFLLWQGLELISKLRFQEVRKTEVEQRGKEFIHSSAGGRNTPTGAPASTDEVQEMEVDDDADEADKDQLLQEKKRSWKNHHAKPFLEFMRPYLNSALQLASVGTGVLGEGSLTLSGVFDF
ncbi:unnamed protein product [Amoebophrya sp. A120]|nr:unnamed protein product [Amoebophrya sp. A120]|eukprot:GSA120T00021908001.1